MSLTNQHSIDGPVAAAIVLLPTKEIAHMQLEKLRWQIGWRLTQLGYAAKVENVNPREYFVRIVKDPNSGIDGSPDNVRRLLAEYAARQAVPGLPPRSFPYVVGDGAYRPTRTVRDKCCLS